MENSSDLDQEIKDALDKAIEVLVALVKVSYAKGRRDSLRDEVEHRILQMAANFAGNKTH